MSELFSLLACPVCRGTLDDANDGLRCESCDRRYPVQNGVPILLHPASIFHGEETKEVGVMVTGSPSAFRRFVSRYFFFNVPLTTWINLELFELLNRCTPDMKILDLGSGVGQFNTQIRPELKLIHMDVKRSDRTDLVADGHYLPFRDESLDGVFSNAVLEHVQRPWIIADEIWRVLKPGGWVFINVPFLNVIHDYHDYYRYTDKGLAVLFSRFEQVAGGVSAGPSSFAGPFLIEYFVCFVPGFYLKAVVRQVLSILAWPVKYLDFLIRRSSHLRVTADAFYFVGVKPHRG